MSCPKLGILESDTPVSLRLRYLLIQKVSLKCDCGVDHALYRDPTYKPRNLAAALIQARVDAVVEQLVDPCDDDSSSPVVESEVRLSAGPQPGHINALRFTKIIHDPTDAIRAALARGQGRFSFVDEATPLDSPDSHDDNAGEGTSAEPPVPPISSEVIHSNTPVRLVSTSRAPVSRPGPIQKPPSGRPAPCRARALLDVGSAAPLGSVGRFLPTRFPDRPGDKRIFVSGRRTVNKAAVRFPDTSTRFSAAVVDFAKYLAVQLSSTLGALDRYLEAKEVASSGVNAALFSRREVPVYVLRRAGDAYVPEDGVTVPPEVTGFYDGSHHGLVTRAGARFYAPTDAPRIAVSTALDHLYQDVIIARLFGVLDVSDGSYTLVEGVPGAGKTLSIIMSAKPGDLIVAETRSTARELQKALPNCTVLTIAAALIHGVPKARRLYVDEALMAMPGASIAIARLASATVVRLYGDRVQIPFINRTQVTLSHTRWFDRDFIATERIVVTKRCPADVVEALRSYYPDWSTTSKVRRSFREVQRIHSVEEIPANPTLGVAFKRGSAYLTLYQWEKDLVVANRPGYTAFTVHEAQGMTFDAVVLVRLITKPSPLHEVSDVHKHGHLVSGLTRHTDALQYVTMSMMPSDNFVRLMPRAPARF